MDQEEKLIGRFLSNFLISADDVQWADVASCDFISSLLKSNEVNATILCTSRPLEEASPFRSILENEETRSHCTQFTVEALTEEGIGKFLEECMGGFAPAADAANLARVMYAKTHGNPFFIRQVCTCV